MESGLSGYFKVGIGVVVASVFVYCHGMFAEKPTQEEGISVTSLLAKQTVLYSQLRSYWDVTGTALSIEAAEYITCVPIEKETVPEVSILLGKTIQRLWHVKNSMLDDYNMVTDSSRKKEILLRLQALRDSCVNNKSRIGAALSKVFLGKQEDTNLRKCAKTLDVMIKDVPVE